MLSILLATYNGAKRLPILLNSLVAQSYHDWIVYIHDDGSTDDTIRICEDFQKQDNRIIILHDSVKHRGAKNSFMWLLEHVEADYYMFCDQDDLWLPFKVQQSFNYIKKLESQFPTKAICIHTDLAVCDENYNIKNSSLWKCSKVIPSLQERIDYMQISNCVTGCTMIFNKKARDISLCMPQYIPMHDFWVAFSVVKSEGYLGHLCNSTILYCQHANNVVGANNVGYRYIYQKLSNLKKVYDDNVSQYKIMHCISGISTMEYLWKKVVFEFMRIFATWFIVIQK